MEAQVVNHDEATMAQMEQIQREVVNSSSLVGELEDIATLKMEYATDDHIYQAKIQDLQSRYSKMRRTRGDGNCFFRAFAFAYLETLLQDSSDVQRFRDVVTKIKDGLLALGYPSFTVDDFHDTFIDVLDSTVKLETTHASLLKNLQEQGISDYIVCYLRLLTSGHLQSNAEFFQAFMERGCTIKEFCCEEVEPMYRESDHVHITALTEAVGVSVRVQYMDRSKGGKVNQHDFPEGVSPRIHILYRPGHYDILYTNT